MSDTMVTMLREKTEEGDLNSILKTSFGGYTKRSVMEYLAFVRKQQQNLKDGYAQEVELLLSERGEMQGEIDAMKEREAGAEEAVAERLRAQEEQLRGEYAALEKDMDEALTSIKNDAVQIKRLQEALTAAQLQAEQAKQEVTTRTVMLDTANEKINTLWEQNAQQSEEIGHLQETEQSLREALAEDTAGELHERISELMADVELLHSEIAIRDKELENRGARLETLTQQEQSNHAAMEAQTEALQKQQESNEKLEAETAELGRRLQEQMEQSIALSRENSRLKASNAIIQRRLDTQLAKAQLAALEDGQAE